MRTFWYYFSEVKTGIAINKMEDKTKLPHGRNIYII